MLQTYWYKISVGTMCCRPPATIDTPSLSPCHKMGHQSFKQKRGGLFLIQLISETILDHKLIGVGVYEKNKQTLFIRFHFLDIIICAQINMERIILRVFLKKN